MLLGGMHLQNGWHSMSCMLLLQRHNHQKMGANIVRSKRWGGWTRLKYINSVIILILFVFYNIVASVTLHVR